MIFLKKQWKNTYLPVDVIKGIYSEEINGEQILEATLLQSAEKHDSILFRLYDGRWVETTVHGATEYRNGTEVYAEHAAYELKQTFIKDRRPNNSPAEQLEMLLEGTRWTVGDVEMGGNYSNSYYYISVYDALKNLANSIGCELRFDIVFNGREITARTVSLVRVLGEDRQRIFSYTKDLLGVTRTIKDDAVTTALIGRGRGEQISETGYGRRLDLSDIDKPDSPLGEIYVEDVDARNLWGIAMPDGSIAHRMSKIEWDDIEDVQTLYERTKEALQDMKEPKFTYKVDVIQLEGDDNLVTLGDPVRVIDQDFLDSELILHGRILRLETDILEHTNSRITIGNLGPDMASYYKNMEEDIAKFRSKSAIWDRSNAFDPNNRLPASYISGMLDKWNEEANLSGGYTYTLDGEGTVTYNKPIDENPTQVVQIVGGTIRIADSKKLDGSWDWRTVLNARGIAGEEIIAQSITANQLRSDAGSNLDLSSNESVSLTVKSISYEKSEIDTIIDDIELTPGPPGTPAVQWTIGSDGYWYADGVKTDKKAIGEDGTDGDNPDIWTIGPNGNWFKNGADTGQPSQGEKGE